MLVGTSAMMRGALGRTMRSWRRSAGTWSVPDHVAMVLSLEVQRLLQSVTGTVQQPLDL